MGNFTLKENGKIKKKHQERQLPIKIPGSISELTSFISFCKETWTGHHLLFHTHFLKFNRK